MSASIVTIPARNDLPWYTLKTTLNGAIYSLRFRYNVRMDRWIMDIADSQDNDLINGIPLLIDRNLNGRFVTAGIPPGMFFVTDDTGKQNQPTRYSFGVSHTLWYYDPYGVT